MNLGPQMPKIRVDYQKGIDFFNTGPYGDNHLNVTYLEERFCAC